MAAGLGGAGGSPSRGGGETARLRALPSGRGRVRTEPRGERARRARPPGRPRFVLSGSPPPVPPAVETAAPLCSFRLSERLEPPPGPPAALKAPAASPWEGDTACPQWSSKAERLTARGL